MVYTLTRTAIFGLFFCVASGAGNLFAAENVPVPNGPAATAAPASTTVPSIADVQARFNELYLPPLNTDQERLQFLVWIHEHIPQFFQQVDRYPVDLFQLLTEQGAIQQRLLENPEFRRLLAERPPLHSLRIATQDGTGIVLESIRVAQDSIDRWRDSLMQALQTTPRVIEGRPVQEIPFDKLIAELVNLMKEFDQPRLGGLIGALVQTMPPDKQNEFNNTVRGGTPVERMRWVQQNLGETVNSETATRIFGLAPNANRAQVAERLSHYAGLERSIEKSKQLLQSKGALAVLLLRNPRPRTFDEAEKRIAALTSNDLAFFLDRRDGLSPLVELLRERGEALAAASNAAPRVDKRLWRNFERDLAAFHNEIGAGTERFTESFRGEIILQEQPPRLTFPRGCAANNCFTQFSFPYPNDPLEVTYYAVDQEGKLLGVVEGTIIDFERKPNEFVRAFYAHTIQGSRLSASEATAILHGLHAEREKLGVEAIVLPTETQSEAFLENISVREVYGRYRQGDPSRIRYRHQQVRGILEAQQVFNEAEYDHVASNSAGFEFHPSPEFQTRLSTSMTERVPHSYAYRAPELTRARLLHFALDMDRSQGEESARRVLQVGGIDEQDFANLRGSLRSLLLTARDENRTVAAYEETIRNWLMKLLGTREEAENYLNKLYDHPTEGRPHLFEGRIYMLNAMTTDNRDRTLNVVRQLWSRALSAEEPLPPAVREFLNNYLDDFAAMQSVEDRLHQLVLSALRKGGDAINSRLLDHAFLIGRSEKLRSLLVAAFEKADADTQIILAKIFNEFHVSDFRAVFPALREFQRKYIRDPIFNFGSDLMFRSLVNLNRSLNRFIEIDAEVWKKLIELQRRESLSTQRRNEVNSILSTLSPEFYAENAEEVLIEYGRLARGAPIPAQELRRAKLVFALDVSQNKVPGDLPAVLQGFDLNKNKFGTLEMALATEQNSVESYNRMVRAALEPFVENTESAEKLLADLYSDPVHRRSAIFVGRLAALDAMSPEHRAETLASAEGLLHRALIKRDLPEDLLKTLVRFAALHPEALVAREAVERDLLAAIRFKEQTRAFGDLSSFGPLIGKSSAARERLSTITKANATNSTLNAVAEIVNRFEPQDFRASVDLFPDITELLRAIVKKPRTLLGGIESEAKVLRDLAQFVENDPVIWESLLQQADQPRAELGLRWRALTVLSECSQDFYDRNAERLSSLVGTRVAPETEEKVLRKILLALQMIEPGQDDIVARDLSKWTDAARSRAMRMIREGTEGFRLTFLENLHESALRFFDVQETLGELLLSNSADGDVARRVEQLFLRHKRMDPELAERLAQEWRLRAGVAAQKDWVERVGEVLRKVNGREAAVRSVSCATSYGAIGRTSGRSGAGTNK